MLLFALPAQADTIGDKKSFFVDPTYDIKQRSQINATMILQSERANFYIEDGYWDGLDSSGQARVRSFTDGIAGEFDRNIYPKETSLLGQEPNPGIDGDPRITIVVGPLIRTIGGYFDTGNGRSKSEIANSNEREMFFLNMSESSDIKRSSAFIAHEFQHLISFNIKEIINKVSDDIWLNELRSEYAVTLVGYDEPYIGSTLDRRAAAFLENPRDSVTEWKNLISDYGSVSIFGEYLRQRWSSKLFKDMLSSKLTGIPSVEEALRAQGETEAFKEVFTDWLVALIINDTSKNPKFGFTRPELRNLRATPVTINIGAAEQIQVQDSLADWQPRWYDLQGLGPSGGQALKIQFDSPSLGSFQVSYLIGKNDGSYELKTIDLLNGAKSIEIDGIGVGVTRVILMPFKKDRLLGFGADEPKINLNMTIARGEQSPLLEKFNLREGDFIRAEGDYNVYIVNAFGYKRLVLSPEICLLYKHLGDRGCFDAVKEVNPEARDAFRTSNYYTDGETNDGKIFLLEITGEDSATLKEEIFSGDRNSIFLINTREMNSYL